MIQAWNGVVVGIMGEMTFDVRKQRHAAAFADCFGPALPYQLFLTEVENPGRDEAFLEYPASSE